MIRFLCDVMYLVVLEIMYCRSFTLCIWADSQPIQLLDHPKTKNLWQSAAAKSLSRSLLRRRNFVLFSLSLEEKPAETQTSIWIASHLVRALNYTSVGHELKCPICSRNLVHWLKSLRTLGVSSFYSGDPDVVLLPENLHTYFELSVQAWTLYKAP